VRLAAVRLAAVLTLAACGGSTARVPPKASADSEEPAAVAPTGPAGPRTLDEDLPRLASRAVEMFEAVAAAVSAAGTDCAAAAAKLRDLRGRYDDVIQAWRKVESDGRGDDLEEQLVPYEARMKAATERMRPGTEACWQNADFDAAFREVTRT